MVLFHCYVSLPEGRFLPANVMFVLPNLDTVHPGVGTVGARLLSSELLKTWRLRSQPCVPGMAFWGLVGWRFGDWLDDYFEAPKTKKPTGT